MNSTKMYTPNFDNYEGFMDYETYKKWVTGFYKSGHSWNSFIDWKYATDSYYGNKPSRRSWENHIENGGSHWTLFSNDGWQMAPASTKMWKNRLQTKVRRMIRRDEFEMKLHKADIEESDSESTETPEEEYWKKSD